MCSFGVASGCLCMRKGKQVKPASACFSPGPCQVVLLKDGMLRSIGVVMHRQQRRRLLHALSLQPVFCAIVVLSIAYRLYLLMGTFATLSGCVQGVHIGRLRTG